MSIEGYCFYIIGWAIIILSLIYLIILMIKKELGYNIRQILIFIFIGFFFIGCSKIYEIQKKNTIHKITLLIEKENNQKEIKEFLEIIESKNLFFLNEIYDILKNKKILIK